MTPLENPPEGYREALRSIKEAAAVHQASPEIESRLLAAFREQPATRSVPRRIWIPYTIGAIAAALLIWFASTVRRPAEFVRAPRKTLNFTPEPQAIVATRVPLHPPGVKTAKRVQFARRAAPLPARPLSQNSSPFLPLPYAEPLAASETAEVIRVQLPRSALLVFGLPVDELRMAERIQADVVLGEDGMVRAVRFVR